MALLLVLGPKFLPEYRPPAAGRLDLPSVALSLGAILPAIYGIKELARSGWQPVPVAAVLVGLAVGVVFARRQRTLAVPLLDLRLLRNRTFATALGGMLTSTMLTGAVMLYLTEHLQLVEGLSPLRAGLCMLPAAAASAVSFLVSPLLARRHRPARLIGAGLALSVLGLLVFTVASGVVALAAGWTVISLGAGPLVTLATDLVIGSVPPERAGAAAAMNETGGQFGFALGIAVLGSVVTAVYRSRIALPAGLSGHDAAAARDTLDGASSVAAHLPAPLAQAVLGPARAAFTDGMHVVAGISAVLLAVVAVTMVTLLRQVPPSGGPAPVEPEPELAAAGC